MKKLTTEQILAVLKLSEIYPSTIWYTNVENAKGYEKVTVQGQKNATKEQIEVCVKSVFPGIRFDKFKTSDKAFTMVLGGREIGSFHLTLDIKETPAPTEVPQEIIQPEFITDGEVVANG